MRNVTKIDADKEFKQIVVAMVKAVFHLLKIHREMILGNSAVIVQDMLRKTPKSLNPVNVVFCFPINQGFAMADGMVLAQPFERVVASEGIRIVDSTLSRFLSNNGHQLFFRHVLYNSRIHLPVALQKAKDDVFPFGSSPASSFASAAKIAFVHLHFAIQSTTLKLRDMIDSFSELLVQAGDRLVIQAKIMRETVCRLLLVEALDDSNLGADLLQRLLFSTALVSTPNIASSCLHYLERTAENTLSPSQKVGRTTKDVLFCRNHKDSVAPCGYETH